MNNNSNKKNKPLHGIFTAVPPKYDLINHIFTFGMDTGWRKKAALACLENNPHRMLDVGCGTGDLSVTVAKLSGGGVKITGLDYSPPMLELARSKATKAGVNDNITFIRGEANDLPFHDNHFDCAGISFAFRNLTYKTPLRIPHLSEVFRVLKPGGRYVIIESSQPENRFIRSIDHVYQRIFVAPVGSLISGNRSAYHYLVDSAIDFYSPGEIRDMLMEIGFSEVRYRPLFFGAAGIHIAIKGLHNV